MGEQSVYSTSIKDNRFSIKCLTISKENFTLNNFIVDTGARITCCRYRFIDKNLRENEVIGCETKYIGGLVKGNVVKFYRYSLKQFTIGNINLGEQDIWITFDERVTDIILGMDILKQIMLIINPYNQRIYFCKDADDYHVNFELTVG